MSKAETWAGGRGESSGQRHPDVRKHGECVPGPFIAHIQFCSSKGGEMETRGKKPDGERLPRTC